MLRKACRWTWDSESGIFGRVEKIEVEAHPELIEETVVTRWGKNYGRTRTLLEQWPEEITVTYFDEYYCYPQGYTPEALHVSVIGINDFLMHYRKY